MKRLARYITQYHGIPSQVDREFWSLKKIEKIRRMALTGKPLEIFSEPEHSNRILDRIRFKGVKGPKRPLNFKAYTNLEINRGIELKYPIYLGDMSYGALSGNPNIVIARTADITETLAGTGEGGLHPVVAKYKRIFIQWASARFGVDIDTLMKGMGIVIKIGQGAKPGIGGHLPGSKVTEPISTTRRIPVGSDAISPAPHHDIYSIEDLGQRIEALKEATGNRPVYVKVAATNYIPYIATGVARMGGDGIIIDGHGAGTGAAPIVVRDTVGLPIELAVSSADLMLRREGLRDNFTIIAAGRVSTADDAAKLIALGADVVSLGTAALISMGCLMIHKCHIGSCPTALTNKIDSDMSLLDIEFGTKMLVNFVNSFGGELGAIVDELGLSSISELRGRRDLLKGYKITRDVAEVLGIEDFDDELIEHKQEKDEISRKRKAYLHELSTKGDAIISSMGSTSPPDVEIPSRILDWLRSDGAQVTRPSIDPYREYIDMETPLAKGNIKISFPVFTYRNKKDLVFRAITWSSYALNLLMLTEEIDNEISDYSERIIAKNGPYIRFEDITIPRGKGFKYVRVPSSLKYLDYVIELAKEVNGIIIDDRSGDEDIENFISILDTELKKKDLRYGLDILALFSKCRGSDDIFRLVALGADAVGISNLFDVVIEERKDYSQVREKVFNILLGIKRELALLSGAAGVYNLHSSMCGNRELLRAIGLPEKYREPLRVKLGGEW